MVLKISKEPPRVSKALFRLYTDYQLFMQKCFRKDGENFRKMRSRPHRKREFSLLARLSFGMSALERATPPPEGADADRRLGGNVKVAICPRQRARASSAPLKMALQLPVGPFLFQNVPTLCLHLSFSIENAWKHDGSVPPGGCVYEYSVMEISSAKLMEFPGNRYFHIISSTCRQIQDDNYEDPSRQRPRL